MLYKVRQILAIGVALAILCAVLWLSFWLALGLGVVLAALFVVRIVANHDSSGPLVYMKSSTRR